MGHRTTEDGDPLFWVFLKLFTYVYQYIPDTRSIDMYVFSQDKYVGIKSRYCFFFNGYITGLITQFLNPK